MTECTHLGNIRETRPRSAGCEECLEKSRAPVEKSMHYFQIAACDVLHGLAEVLLVIAQGPDQLIQKVDRSVSRLP